MMHGAKANILEAVGGTPIVKLNRVVPPDLQAEIYVKCEYMNPAGSMKDRIGINIIRRAEEEGRLKPGGTIVEATSGNTGAGLAMVAAVKGYRCIFVMPDKMSQEKIAALRAWGAKVVVCPTAVEPADPRSYYSVARRLSEETPNAILANQYHNPANPEAHYLTTGPEIWAQTNGEFDAFVSGMGTGGTLSGTGKFLKEKNPNIQIVGVDPVGSVYYDFVKHGQVTRPFTYKVEGIGEDFFPSTMNLKILDDCVRVDDRECFMMTKDLVRLEGIYCGGSCGAAVAGAIKWAMARNKKERILVLLADSAGRYLTKIFNDDWMRENGFTEGNPSLGTVHELLQLRPQNLVTARSDDTLRHVVSKMKSLGISQLPVVDGDVVKGIITEVDVLRNLVSGEAHLDGTIANILDSDYATVTPDTRVDLLQGVLAEAKVALVADGLKLLGLITKIDLIDYLTRRAAESL
ncbi:MAG: cystathionine beta-synthase [Myxococcales bacterium]|nr:cystathionine beta-synthase [Myxococcales bacterium]